MLKDVERLVRNEIGLLYPMFTQVLPSAIYEESST